VNLKFTISLINSSTVIVFLTNIIKVNIGHILSSILTR